MTRCHALILLCAMACTDPPVGGGGGGGRGRASCLDDEQRCSGATVQRCIAGVWSDETTCGNDQRCTADGCQDGGCTPGVTRCEAGGRITCDDQGETWQADPCPEGEACSGDGRCGRADCEPGATRCVEIDGARWPQRERCNDDGSAWESMACRRGESCVAEGECRQLECLPGATTCFDADTIGICNDEGTAVDATEDCPAGSRCTNGTCVSACNEARLRQSYDGCTFFAVDLPQTSSADIYTDPYAVTLANPSDLEVRVRITSAGDRVVNAATNVRVPGAAGIDQFSGRRIGDTRVSSFIVDGQGGRREVSGPIDQMVIPARGLGTFILPNNNAGLAINGGTVSYTSELENRAYRVDTSAPVTAYQFSPLCCSHSYSNDASILFPAGSQGRQYVGVSLPYLGMMQGAPADSPGFLSIVASDEESVVEIDVGNRRIQPVPGVANNGGRMTATLRPYQVLTLMSANGGPAQSDLTGVTINASTEVAVFGGSVCTELPHGSPACDHVESALMPVETWRNEYIGAHTHHRSGSRNEVNYYRIVASSAGSRLTFDPPLSGLASHGAIAGGLPDCRSLDQGGAVDLRPGAWCEFGTRQDFVVSGTGPIQMVQFVTSQDTTGLRGEGQHAGDPAMSAVPPSEQYRSQYTFLTPETYYANYLNVIHPLGAIIELDGVAMTPATMGNPGRTPYIEQNSTPIGRGAWALTIIRIGAGAHSISSSTMDRFGIMAYAYDDYVSYAFPGGLDLAKR